MSSILALIHGGKSFVHQIHSACQELNLQLTIASSKIVDQSKIDELNELSTTVYVSVNSDLNFNELYAFVEQQKVQGNNIIGVITVWENYRSLMAELNFRLECPDLRLTQVQALRDKLNLRRTLRSNNYSQVNSEPLTEELFNKIQKSDKPSFIKPRQGIASFGAFKLSQHISWLDVTQLISSIQQDEAFGSSFTKDVDLIVEDFIGGTEYCLEIICFQGTVHVIAVHEKVEIEQIDRLTTLENVSATPPISLTSTEIESLNLWITNVFNLFDIQYGCFHVEAKLDATGWEIIEINPRVGGAYINESVEYVTGYSLLNLWLRILTADSTTGGSPQPLLNQLSTINSSRNRGSFFRVFYAEPGRTIQSLNFKNQTNTIRSKVLMTPGTKVPDSNRELYIAQGLWSWSGNSANSEELVTAVAESAQELEVVYD